MDSVKIDLGISAEQYLSYYKGHTRTVMAIAKDGRRIQFPATLLRQFLTRDGIHGQFLITFDARHKLTNIRLI